jgi:hypothetical protein
MLHQPTGNFTDSSNPLPHSPRIYRHSPKSNNGFLCTGAYLCYKTIHIMKTILLMQLFHLATEAAHHLYTIIQTIGHLVK